MPLWNVNSGGMFDWVSFAVVLLLTSVQLSAMDLLEMLVAPCVNAQVAFFTEKLIHKVKSMPILGGPL